MDLVDRYIQAVKQWLPRAQKEDIAAELGEDIRSEIQEREGELGRKLQSAEVESLLRRRGRPIVAAGRFRKQESLIGPTLFPIYVIALKALAVPFAILTVVKWAVPFVSSPSFLHGKAGAALLLNVASAFWSTAFLLFGGVTLVFAILERVQTRANFLERWNPRDLQPIREKGRIERSSSITELAIQVAFFLWWVRPSALLRLESHGSTWSAGPTWEHLHHGFFVPVLIVSLATIGLSYANLISPNWTRARLVVRAVTHWAAALLSAIVVIQGWANFRGEWRLLRGAGDHVSGAAGATALTDLLIYQCLVWVAIGASIAFIVDVIRAIRFRSPGDTELRPAPQSTEAFCL
jgi:hypothetical protein